MNRFDNGGVNRCIQLELPSHIYHIQVDEFDFGSSPTAGGLAGSLMLTRFLQTMLFDIKAADPITFSSLATLLAAVALVACLIPAQRASRVDPLLALRHE